MERLIATVFVKRMTNGATGPINVLAEDTNGRTYDIVLKFENAQLPITGLVRETFAARLGSVLGLPLPQAFFVEIDPLFIASIAPHDPGLAELLSTANCVGFGSLLMQPGFSTWPAGFQVPGPLMALAAEVLAFDVLLRNDDRAPKNPNMLWNGTVFALIDHEKALVPPILSFDPAIWAAGAASNPVNSHLFGAALKSTVPNLGRFAGAWAAVSDNFLNDICQDMPVEWAQTEHILAPVRALIEGVRDHMADCILELHRALT